MASEEPAYEQLHVLRHRFLPSEPLAHLFAEMSILPPGATMPRFFLLSTRAVSFEMQRFHRDEYSRDLRDVKRDLEDKKRQPIFSVLDIADGEAEYRPKDASLKFSLKPARPEVFHALTNPLIELGTPVPPVTLESYRVTTVIRQTVLSREAILRAKEVWLGLKAQLQSPDGSSLYGFSPDGIVGMDVRRYIKLEAEPTASRQAVQPVGEAKPESASDNPAA